MRSVNRTLNCGPSILIGRKGTIDNPFFVDGPFWTVDTLFYAKVSEHHDPRFVFEVVRSINWLRYAETTGVPSLSADAIRSAPIHIPSAHEEQAQIAKFAHAMDRKISREADNIEAMQAFKKGLLQKLFA
jgi:type I restriction enzyme S subunit